MGIIKKRNYTIGEKVSKTRELFNFMQMTGKKHPGGSQSMLGEGNVVTSVISVSKSADRRCWSFLN